MLFFVQVALVNLKNACLLKNSRYLQSNSLL